MVDDVNYLHWPGRGRLFLRRACGRVRMFFDDGVPNVSAGTPGAIFDEGCDEGSGKGGVAVGGAAVPQQRLTRRYILEAAVGVALCAVC